MRHRKHSRHWPGSAGMSLVELLVVIMILGLLMAFVLSAVVATRESARRAQCQNQLRQIATAVHSYVGRNHVFPMGAPQFRYPDVGIFVGHSAFVAILPDLEQAALYQCVNFDKNIYTVANQTVHEAAVGWLWCPSEPSIQDTQVYQGTYLDIPYGQFRTAYSSYGLCAGTWYHRSNDLALLRQITRQDNGLSFINSAVGLADIGDGLSHTLLATERSQRRLVGDARMLQYWWFDGYHADTTFSTLYPINPPARLLGSSPVSPYFMAASSGHSSWGAGGANFAFADGSVRFLRDRIQSWTINPATLLPDGLTGNPETPYQMARGSQFGVYQSLSTRNGGEPISADD